ncbi:MAG: lipopolysaccharide assembly protein LapB [Pseudomonadota bacterium]
MNDLAVFSLLFLAIAIGWLLGRRSAPSSVNAPELPSQYYKGLNDILDGRPDGAIDSFINALEVNTETLETHIALGNLLRKKGEVERAIRIHQNLLARPSLPRLQVHQAHLELARDYISAGLYDRAERLLLDLLEESPEQRRAGQMHLLEIYQSQRDWQRAIEIAGDMLPRKSLLNSASDAEAGSWLGQDVAIVLPHLYCELAAEYMQKGELEEARRLLLQAFSRDKHCVRAAIMLGEVELGLGNHRRAIKSLRRVRQQDADYVPETLPTLRRCYVELGEEHAYREYLMHCLERNPSAPLVLALAEALRSSGGEEEAAGFLTEQLARQPSLRGLERLIRMQLEAADDGARDSLELLHLLVERLIEERPAYRCSHCGFSGRNLHWSCPSCKYWGTMKSIRGSRKE